MCADKTIVILTGAGISAESGLQTFRAEDGLWCDHRVEDVATPEAFARDPELVHAFYNMRRKQLSEVQPNAAHYALARLGERWDGHVLLVTQNVDDLHERAMAQHAPKEGFALIHMHGELNKARCIDTGEVVDWVGDMTLDTVSPYTGRVGGMRPHIVWFGEMPFEMTRIYDTLRACDLFISIGTSGNVYPAAGFVAEAGRNGRAHTVELNLEPSAGATMFAETRYGKAGTLVPAYVDEILDGQVI